VCTSRLHLYDLDVYQLHFLWSLASLAFWGKIDSSPDFCLTALKGMLANRLLLFILLFTISLFRYILRHIHSSIQACIQARFGRQPYICKYIYPSTHLSSHIQTHTYCSFNLSLPIMSQRIIARNKPTMSPLLLCLGHQYELRQSTECGCVLHKNNTDCMRQLKGQRVVIQLIGNIEEWLSQMYQDSRTVVVALGGRNIHYTSSNYHT